MKKLFICACIVWIGSIAVTAPAFNEISDEESNPANVIRVKSGEEFAIVLKSNAATGYQWQIGEEPDAAKIEYVTDEYLKSSSNRVSAPGKEKWVFKARSPGKAVIVMEYLRRWEKGVPPARTLNFDVEIE